MCLDFPNMPDKLTPAEQRLLEFIEGNWEEFLFMSIGQFSERMEISEATISRFARHLGCQDFKQLKTMVMEQNHLEGPAGKMAGTLLADDSFQAIKYMQKQQIYLNKTMEQLEEPVFENAISEIKNAKRIFIHAKSASTAVGELFFFRLRRLGLQVIKFPSAGSEMLEGLAQVEAGDLVISFGFSKTSLEGRTILDYQKESGYRTMLFTSRIYLPKEEQADVNLYVYRGEEKEYHSMTTAIALVDTLVVAVSEQLGKDGTDRLQRIHKLKQIYRK